MIVFAHQFPSFPSLFIIGLQKRPDEVDRRAANMYTFALILWEIGTSNVPFGGMSPMCAGLKVRGVALGAVTFT